ncbi:hypothetical protein KFL_007340070 [Klebsormidium nitens]|uniref:ACT domain-containing protein n=1 Tax=Klebsormidium nitens TaxID=105231 RepID=A0A1Y1IR92_KLENI|nr:hypothetical protein KFL_007340070 [Klebsormidium nitens]|eukprot:GAQ91147.1 hypothetical protein KFL_007340070 [Klebsormidium nitens]
MACHLVLNNFTWRAAGCLLCTSGPQASGEPLTLPTPWKKWPPASGPNTAALSHLTRRTSEAGSTWPSHHIKPLQRFTNGRYSIACKGTPVAESAGEPAVLPTPFINLDQDQKEDVTVVELKFGDRLGALLDTMKALRELGVNVVKAKVSTVERVGWNKFEITNKDGGKVTDPELVEAIRLTVIENLLQYHPESSAKLAMGLPSPQAIQIPTSITVSPVDATSSCIHVETPDRPGLLLEIVKVLTDISVVIKSADIHTEGLVALDDFVVSYQGEALNKSMKELVTNALQFYLTRYSLEEDSY